MCCMDARCFAIASAYTSKANEPLTLKKRGRTQGSASVRGPREKHGFTIVLSEIAEDRAGNYRATCRSGQQRDAGRRPSGTKVRGCPSGRREINRGRPSTPGQRRGGN